MTRYKEPISFNDTSLLYVSKQGITFDAGTLLSPIISILLWQFTRSYKIIQSTKCFNLITILLDINLLLLDFWNPLMTNDGWYI